MFGQIKENILTEMAVLKNSPKELKIKFSKFTKVLKDSKDLSQFYNLYEQVESAHFENDSISKEFLNECLSQLNNLDILEIEKLKALSETANVKLSKRTELLDKLVFGKLSITERINTKFELISFISESKKSEKDFKEAITLFDKKLKEDDFNLSEEQKNLLTLFVEDDEVKINDVYKNLIESTTDILDNIILNSENITEAKKIIETKKKLIKLKSEKPSINVIDEINQLKQSLAD